MTTVVVPVDPPVPGVVLSSLVPDPLDAEEAERLYRAMVADVCATVQKADTALLVNYRPADQVDADVESAVTVREMLAEELPHPDAARYEPQVGQTRAGRIGNSLTHLLETEGEDSVAVLDPTAVLFRRDHLGSLFMKLRTTEVVIGATADGRLYGAAFTEPIDFADALAPPAIETLTRRAIDAGHGVDFLPQVPVLETPRDLESLSAHVSARVLAGRTVPRRTVATLAALNYVPEALNFA